MNNKMLINVKAFKLPMGEVYVPENLEINLINDHELYLIRKDNELRYILEIRCNKHHKTAYYDFECTKMSKDGKVKVIGLNDLFMGNSAGGGNVCCYCNQKVLEDKSERISFLTEIIDKALHAYYVNKKPIMSDFEYDKLSKELSELKKEDKNE